MKVVYFFRKPFTDYFSIEELFGFIQTGLTKDVEFQNYYLKRVSKGLRNRIISCFEVIKKQGEVNHITGDVHFIALLMKKRKTILTIHDLEVLNRLHGLSRKIIKYFWFTLPAHRVRYITVISEFTKLELLKIIDVNPEKIVVIHNCFSPALKPKQYVFNDIKPNILHIGTAHNKNIERLIEALNGMQVKLTILGHLKDHQKKLLEQHHIEYDNFYNLAYPEVIKRYEEADIVSFISLYEGFGMPIIEANAVGRPVITSNRTSMPEVAGKAALLVDPEQVDTIKQAIIQLITDSKLRDKLIQEGQSNIQRFTPQAIASRYAHLYKTISMNH